jgi:anti-sigma factor ChrR (cupin superfamily)
MSDAPKQPPLSVEQEQDAALAALGMVGAREAMALPRDAIVRMTEAAALLAENAAPVAPSPSVRDRLMARVAAYETLRPIADVRRDEGSWIPLGGAGVEIKRLFQEKATGRTTYLVRMEPGAKLAPHRHTDVEQCLVLKGDIRWGEVAYEEGDFVVMGKGTEHPELHSVNGNLLLLISGSNEF